MVADRRARRRLLVALAVVAGVVASPAFAAPASAHATLQSTDPVDGAVLPAAPDQVTLTFDEPVEIRTGGVRLLDAAGDTVAAETRSVDTQVVIAVPPDIADGTYVVSWRVISLDTHPVAGGLTFSVGAPSAGVVSVPVVEPSAGLRTLRQAGEAVGYAGVLASVGLVVYLLVLLPGQAGGAPVAERVRRRLQAVLRGSVPVACAAAVAAVPITVAWQDGADLGALLRGQTWSAGLTSDTALGAVLIVAGLVAAIVAAGLAGNGHRRRLLVITAFTGAAVALGAFAVVGHTRTFGPPWLLLSVDLVHVSTAAVWFGGLIGLSLTLARSSDATPPVAASAVVRFSRLAAVLVVLLGGAGVLMGWRVLDSWSALWNTSYGTVLLVKVAAALLVLPIAGYNRYWLVPAVSRLGSGAGADAGAAWRRLRRTVRAEAVLLVAVLGLTGVLITQSPVEQAPAQPAGGSEAAGTTEFEAELGTGRVVVRLTPGSVGVNALELTILDSDGQPLEPVAPPELSVTLPERDVGPLVRPLSQTGRGAYEAVADFPLAGSWTIEISVRTSTYENPIAEIPVEIR